MWFLRESEVEELALQNPGKLLVVQRHTDSMDLKEMHDLTTGECLSDEATDALVAKVRRFK